MNNNNIIQINNIIIVNIKIIFIIVIITHNYLTHLMNIIMVIIVDKAMDIIIINMKI